VVYVIVEPDDDTCEKYTNVDKCLADPSPLSNDETKCYWNSANETCHFRSANNDMLRIVIAAIMAALLTAPLAFLMEWITMTFLAGKAEDKATLISPISDDAEAGMIHKENNTSSRLISIDDEFKDCITKLMAHRDMLNENQAEDFDGN
jgi:hypothetical protein